MKSAIIALCIFACAYATVIDQTAQVLVNDFEQNPEGGFKYSYKTENGIGGEAQGQLKAVSKDEVALEVSGVNTYTSPEGKVIETKYIANENGYQAYGEHLPTPPAPEPIPEYIQRALAYIAAHPYTEKN